MKTKLKRVARIGLKALSAATDPLFGLMPGPRILIYHQVGVNFGREMEVSTENFIRQLDWMQTNGEIVDLETAIERRGTPRDDKLFVLTFDDGFSDVYENAFPIMKERAVPFTLYLTTEPIETQRPLDPLYPDARPLRWEQVSDMKATGLASIGVHTHTHPDLRKLSAAEIRDEFDRSDMAVVRATGELPKHFTYPWGWWSKEADSVARSRYASATTGSPSPLMRSSDPFMLGRYPVQRSDEFTWFRRRMHAGFRIEQSVRQRVAAFVGP